MSGREPGEATVALVEQAIRRHPLFAGDAKNAEHLARAALAAIGLGTQGREESYLTAPIDSAGYIDFRGSGTQARDAVRECAEKVRSFEDRWPRGMGMWTLNDVADELLRALGTQGPDAVLSEQLVSDWLKDHAGFIDIKLHVLSNQYPERSRIDVLQLVMRELADKFLDMVRALASAEKVAAPIETVVVDPEQFYRLRREFYDARTVSLPAGDEGMAEAAAGSERRATQPPSATSPAASDLQERAHLNSDDPLVDVALELTALIGRAASESRLGIIWGDVFSRLAAIRAEAKAEENAVIDALTKSLRRTRAKLRDFIREHPDPGADALAVEWEAGDVLAANRPSPTNRSE